MPETNGFAHNSRFTSGYRKIMQVGIAQAENYSSHSLRRGLATAASRDGASLAAIMRQGRWKNVNTVMEYVDAAQRFEENAAYNILKKFTSKIN